MGEKSDTTCHQLWVISIMKEYSVDVTNYVEYSDSMHAYHEL
jgi:hypothetical protein